MYTYIYMYTSDELMMQHSETLDSKNAQIIKAVKECQDARETIQLLENRLKVLQCVARVLQCVEMCGRVLRCVEVCCSVSVLQ